jgi:hypothetical protein
MALAEKERAIRALSLLGRRTGNLAALAEFVTGRGK